MLVGCAGWALPKDHRSAFPPGPSRLARYAGVFPAAEINSSFHRPHRRQTYERWGREVPGAFRFSIKLPRTVTHDLRLQGVDEPLERFCFEAGGLGEKLACILVQLPPSLELDRVVAGRFFSDLRRRGEAKIACEPRHPSWFEADADALLRDLGVARVAADPARVPAAARPGGWRGFEYHRLHGSPRMYYSGYDTARLATLAAGLREAAARTDEVWCIFDNTAVGAAVPNALELLEMLRG